MNIAYAAGTVFTGTGILSQHAVLVKDQRIAGIVPRPEIPADYTLEALDDCLIAPAFIDLQIYGGNGKLFSTDLDIESLEATDAYCRAGGCSHFMITMATNSMEKFRQGIAVVKQGLAAGNKGLLGLHLEGPYIHPLKRGAHQEQFIRKPTVSEVRGLLDEAGGVVRMMTLAPELCDPEVVALLLSRDVIVSAGHSNASYREAYDSFEAGIPAATHLFNAMSPFQGRAPGMVGAIYDHPSVMSSIICDGIHVDFASVRISRQIMGDRLFFITDAVTEIDRGEYRHVFKKDHYTLEDGTLSGSALNMIQSIRNAVEKAGIPIADALKMGSTNPARLIGDSHLGVIREGLKADFLVIGPQSEIRGLIGNGQ